MSTGTRHEEGTTTGILASGERQVLFLPRLTIRKLAQALKDVEKNQSYAHALACVDLLDYESVCALADPDDPNNDPNLMPSRFMVLRGATDAGLKAKGNLDNYPYPLGKGMPKECGCQALADFLILAGAIDGPWPKWWAPDSEGRKFESCDEEVSAAFCDYADGRGPIFPLGELPEEHKVSAGENLGSISERYGLRSWTLLWELNKSSLGSPADPLAEGTSIKLPTEGNLDTSAFEDWIEGYSGIEPADEYGYYDPRTVLLDESGKFIYHFVEITDSHFLSDGFVPRLSEESDLPQAIATVVRHALKEPNMGCLVLGHCDPNDSAENTQELSLRRAKAIRAILARDPDAWLGVVRDASDSDLQASLAGIAAAKGWNCQPGSSKDSMSAAVKAFRSACNATYDFGLDKEGDWGPLDWKAVHRVLCGLVAQRMLEPDPPDRRPPEWPDIELQAIGEDGALACGDRHPIPDDLKSVYASRTHRRVELVFAPAPLLEIGDGA